MNNSRNIILVGFMGTGKTTVGKALAARLQRDFVDMDVELEARVGKAIPRIFAEDGEQAFRRLERALVVELSARSNLVIATGGGIVLNPDNICDFSATGCVICLNAAPDEILRRVAASDHRPLLEQGSKEKRIRDLFRQRRRFYDAIAIQVDTSGKNVDEIIARIQEVIPDS